jgi:hypothetical protein
MARGWESKGIEMQQEEASRRKTPAPGHVIDPAVARRRQALELARARAVADLGRATAPAHRAMLEAALRSIDEDLKQARD